MGIKSNLLAMAVAFAAASFLLGSHVFAAELSAGVAVVDITPTRPYRMSGYFNERISTGTKDPLHAKVIVLQQGEVRAALVMCDLIGIDGEIGLAARKLAESKTQIPWQNIIITATHSHTGPLHFGVLRDFFHQQAVAAHGSDPHEELDYPAFLQEQIATAVHRAQQSAKPASMSVGIAEETRLSFNRRFHMKDGTVRFNPGALNPDIVRVAGPIDPDVGLVQFSVGDKPLALLTVFAMHLDTLGGTEFSADYPRFLSDAVQAKLGQNVVSLFGAGTCGDINHVDVTRTDRRKTEEIGKLLAETVLSKQPTLQAGVPSLAIARTVVSVPLQRYDDAKVQRARDALPKIGGRELSFLEQVEACKIVATRRRKSENLSAEVHAVRLGPDTAVVTLPGEVFVELGLAIKKASPFANTLVIELANDTPAYIPTKKAFAEGSYETVNSIIQPGGGEMLVEAANKLLQELAASQSK